MSYNYGPSYPVPPAIGVRNIPPAAHPQYPITPLNQPPQGYSPSVDRNVPKAPNQHPQNISQRQEHHSGLYINSPNYSAQAGQALTQPNGSPLRRHYYAINRSPQHMQPGHSRSPSSRAIAPAQFPTMAPQPGNSSGNIPYPQPQCPGGAVASVQRSRNQPPNVYGRNAPQHSMPNSGRNATCLSIGGPPIVSQVSVQGSSSTINTARSSNREQKHLHATEAPVNPSATWRPRSSFSCPPCQLNFRNGAEHEAHMRDDPAHGAGRTYKCNLPWCHASFDTLLELSQHWEAHGHVPIL